MAPVEEVEIGETLQELVKAVGAQMAFLAYSAFQPNGRVAFNLTFANDAEMDLRLQIETVEQVIRALFVHHKRLVAELNSHRIIIPGGN